MVYNQRYNCYVSKEGLIFKIKRDRLMLAHESYAKPCSLYHRVSLEDTYDNVRKDVKVHRVVYSAFYGDIPIDMQIDHIDGNKENNSISNLRCVTPKENSNNPSTAWKTKGERNGMFGKYHTDGAKVKMSINRRKRSRWVVEYGKTLGEISSLLKIGTKSTEKLFGSDELKEMLHGLV